MSDVKPLHGTEREFPSERNPNILVGERFCAHCNVWICVSDVDGIIQWVCVHEDGDCREALPGSPSIDDPR